jgi:hypothetical protein
MNLRPLSVGDILDGAFTLYRRNFASFFLIALIPVVPLILMWIALPFMLTGASGADLLTGVAVLISTPYTAFASTLLWAALVYATMRAYEGETPGTGESLVVGLKRFLSVLIAGIVVFIAILLGFIFFIVPGLIFAAMFFAFIHAIVIERCDPFDALGRSRKLSKGARMRILGVSLLAGCITILPGMALSAIAGVAGGWGMLMGGAEAVAVGGWVGGLTQAGSVLVTAITTPFSVAVLTLLYIDRRARTEAPDLEAAAERLGSTI